MTNPGFEAIINSMPEGIIALEDSLDIIFVNPCAMSLFKLEPNEKKWQGMSLLEFSRSAEL